jgi:hypothetical protein
MSPIATIAATTMRTPIAIQAFRLSAMTFSFSSEGSFIDKDAAELDFFPRAGSGPRDAREGPMPYSRSPAASAASALSLYLPPRTLVRARRA